MEHLTVRANGAAFHVAQTGTGRPLLLLHGWPEFWLSWEPVMTLLADRFTLYAPDLRGFGDSDKPEGLFGPDQQAADMLALMDALGLKQAGIVGHDVGGALMQPLARLAPGRLAGLFFFDFVYPGIGAQMGAPGPPEGNLVPVIQPARARPSAGRRHTRTLQGLCRALPAPLGVSQGRL